MINAERLLTEFCELVKIKSCTRGEREVADVVKAKLFDLGLEVMEDGVASKIDGNCGNVFGFLRGNISNAPALMLSAHLDSVAPCAGIDPQVKDGVVTSGGDTVLGADDKSGVVAVLEALRVVKENKMPHGDIRVVFTVAEEGGLNGSNNLDRKLLKADLGYVLDSSGKPGKIVTAAPGLNKINVIIRGKAAHAGSAPEEGINAIVVAGKALAQIKQGRIDAETTANVGAIKGGSVTNIVPDYVEIFCEARSRSLKKLVEQTNHMTETFKRVAAANGAQAEVVVKKMYDPYVLTNDMPVIALAKQAAESIGLNVSLEAAGGGSDANTFNSFKMPTAALATGMSKVHTTNEYIRVDDLGKTAKLVLALITTAAGVFE